MSNEIVRVSVSSLAPINHQGQRVITLSMMDKAHGRPDGTARRAFNTHKAKLIDGRHFFSISQPDEIRSLGLGRADGSTPASVTILSERGYLVLVKSFTDDLAWQVQEQLVDGYFRGKVEVPVPTQLSRMEILQLAFEAEKENSILRPKAAAFDAYDVGGGYYMVSEVWRTIGVRQDTLTEWLTSKADLSWAYRNREGGALIPLKPAIDAGLVALKRFPTVNANGTVNRGSPILCLTDRGLNIVMERAARINLRQGCLELVQKAA